MEEQVTPNQQQPKAEKKTTKKKPVVVVDEAKVREAKKKVNDLLQGTGLEDPTSDVFVPPTQGDDSAPAMYGNDNATSWLNDQVSALTQQVETYQQTIEQLKKDNAALYDSLNGRGQNNGLDGSDKAKIIELYKHFEGIYNGRTKGQRFGRIAFSYPQQGSGVLDMFLSTFVFLHDHKEYQHWGE